uniref:Retrotransposon Gag like 8A n=1 Tax=Pan troglodytes TaxID=9598 RepID=A0A2I3SV47_PANTR
MGGGRGLLGWETLGPGGGCSGKGSLCQWPPLGSPQARRDVPCAPVPSRVVLAFVPGIALQAPAAAPGPHSGARCLRPLDPAPPCTFGRCPALQVQAGLLLHTGQTTHSRCCQPTSTPPDCQPTTSFCPQTYATTAIAIHRISPTDCGS